MRMRSACRAAIVAVVTSQTLMAQPPSNGLVRQPYATRTDLQTRLAELEATSTRSAPANERSAEELRAETWLLRYRLDNGDFHIGDRVLVRVQGQPALTDTFAVRAEQTIELPALGTIGLRGVLRSELSAHLEKELSRFIRMPAVNAIPLVRIAVLGRVGRPGFYDVPADMLLSDVLMLAGGPTTDADLDKLAVRRISDPILQPRDLRIALADGMSLDHLNMRSGMQVLVPPRRPRDWVRTVQGIGMLAGVASVIVALLR